MSMSLVLKQLNFAIVGAAFLFVAAILVGAF
jgi:hypothetical protein